MVRSDIEASGDEQQRHRELVLYGPAGRRVAEFLRLLRELDEESFTDLDERCKAAPRQRTPIGQLPRGARRAYVAAENIVAGYGFTHVRYAAAAAAAALADTPKADLPYPPSLGQLLTPFEQLELE